MCVYAPLCHHSLCVGMFGSNIIQLHGAVVPLRRQATLTTYRKLRWDGEVVSSNILLPVVYIGCMRDSIVSRDGKIKKKY